MKWKFPWRKVESVKPVVAPLTLDGRTLKVCEECGHVFADPKASNLYTSWVLTTMWNVLPSVTRTYCSICRPKALERDAATQWAHDHPKEAAKCMRRSKAK